MAGEPGNALCAFVEERGRLDDVGDRPRRELPPAFEEQRLDPPLIGFTERDELGRRDIADREPEPDGLRASVFRKQVVAIQVGAREGLLAIEGDGQVAGQRIRGWSGVERACAPEAAAAGPLPRPRRRGSFWRTSGSSPDVSPMNAVAASRYIAGAGAPGAAGILAAKLSCLGQERRRRRARSPWRAPTA